MGARIHFDDARGCEWSASALVGSTLAGRWSLVELLGLGASSAVFAARHATGLRGAVKLLRPHVAVSASARARLRREARIANRLARDGAVAVLDGGVDGDSVFLVMELLEGQTLQARLGDRGGRLPIEEALDMVDGLLEVLAAAHCAGIVHRDVKPQNVFVERSGRVRVLDFGLARFDGLDCDGFETASYGTLGTPAFMSPEQARGRTDEIDARADVWGVGATLFKVLTSRPVHEGRTAGEMIILSGTQPAPPVAPLVPRLSRPVAAVINRALAFSPADRWATAGAMREALAKARGAPCVRRSRVRAGPLTREGTGG
jgi:serine/threonine protein kinase